MNLLVHWDLVGRFLSFLDAVLRKRHPLGCRELSGLDPQVTTQGYIWGYLVDRILSLARLTN